MKKKLAVCLLVLSLIFGSVNAMAAVGVKDASKDDNAAVQSVEKSDDGKFVTVQYKGEEKDAQYTVIAIPEDMGAPTKTSINNNQEKVVAYMNQATADGEGLVTFNIHPIMEKKGDFGIYISSTDVEPTKVGSFTLDDLIAMFGDVNGDGNINNADKMILARFLAHWEGYGPDADASSRKVVTGNADVNNDGSVNNADKMVLARYLAHWLNYENLPFSRS